MKKIYTNAGAQIAGKILTAIIAIFLIRILTEYLSLEGYGLYSKIYNYLSIFATIADMGLYTIAVREIAKAASRDDEREVERISGNILTIRSIGGVIIILLSILTAVMIPGYNSTTALICVGIVGVFTLLGLINSSILALLQARLKSEFSLISSVAGKLFTLGGLVMLTWLIPRESSAFEAWGLISVMLIGLLGNLVMTLMLYFYALRSQQISFRFDRSYIFYILRETLPFGVALFLGVIYFKVDVIILSIMESSAVHDVSIALYSLPMKIIEVGMVFGTVYLNSLLPVLSSDTLSKEAKHRITHTAAMLLGIIGMVISISLAFGANSIITLIGGEEYIREGSWFDSVHVLMITSWIFVIYFLASLSNYLLIKDGRQKELLAINLCVTIVNIALNILLIPHYSFIGAAIATLISQILLTIITFSRLKGSGIYDTIPKQEYLFICLTSISSILLLSIATPYLPKNIGGLIMLGGIIILMFSGVLLRWWRFNSSTTHAHSL